MATPGIWPHDPSPAITASLYRLTSIAGILEPPLIGGSEHPIFVIGIGNDACAGGVGNRNNTAQCVGVQETWAGNAHTTGSLMPVPCRWHRNTAPEPSNSELAQHSSDQ